MSDSPQVRRLMAVLDEAGEAVALPALLQPADLFVELAGEEFRKRLFLTEGAEGESYCLRPDFTIPVCLEHLRSGRESPVAYTYRGKIFRKRRAVGEPEFEQAGTEWIGHAGEMATDAALYALAARCADAVGLAPRVRVGDANVFGALTEALGLSPSWRARLLAAFGDEARLTGTLDRLARRASSDGIAARLAPALARVDAAQARAIVDAVVGLPDPSALAGRSPEDIAERILEQAGANGADAEATEVMARYFALSAPLDRAADTLARFARAEGLDIDDTLAAFAARADALAGHGVDLSSITFEARFGRRIGYYTGFVFEMIDPRRPAAEVIAGGRYDKLIALLDPRRALPAIGFSVWLDRLPEAP
jgi:ATP phosphoribosyltransferase regulatory subunit